MSTKEIEQTVTDILVEKLGIAQTEITPDANLIKDLGIDSLDYAELVMEFEQFFKIKIPDQDAESLKTVENTIHYINQKVEQGVNA